MINFGKINFWDQYAANTQHLDDLLAKNDTTIEELLDDDNIIQELKNLNPRLLNFFHFENVRKLVNYITIEPNPEEKDEKKLYKYPFISCELLILESNTILDTFFMQEDPPSDDESPLHIDSDPPSVTNLDENKKGLKEEDFLEFQEEKKKKNLWEEDDEEEERKEVKEEENQCSNPENYKINIIKSDSNKKDEDEEPAEPAEPKVYRGKKGEMLKDFFNFLKKEKEEEELETEEQKKKELNVTLAGYFNKVCLMFLNKKQREFLEYVLGNEEIIEMLVENVGVRSIAEILHKILAFENSDGESFIEQRKNITNLIIRKLDENTDFELINNVYFVLIEILTKNQQIVNKEDLIRNIFSSANIDFLIELMISKNKTLSSMTASFFTSLFIYILTNENKESDDERKITKSLIDESLLNKMADKIPDLINFLFDFSSICTLKTTYGQEIEPLGLNKIRIIEMMGCMIRLDNVKINQNIALHGFFTRLLEIFDKYKWNNMLHLEVEKIVTFALESESHILSQSVLKYSNLVDFLYSSIKETKVALNKNKNGIFRIGNLGHITKIANNLEKLCKIKEEFKEEIESEKWRFFTEEYLNITNSNNNKDIGGHNSVKKTEKDFDSTMSFDRAEIEEKFSKFLSSSSKKKEEKDNIPEDSNFWAFPNVEQPASDASGGNFWNMILNQTVPVEEGEKKAEIFQEWKDWSFTGEFKNDENVPPKQDNQILDVKELIENPEQGEIEGAKDEFISNQFWKLNPYTESKMDKLIEEEGF